ncbi:PRAME family member 12-like [Nannospalax galili]|uniref:PRAME family member 12-like n=1 Tax=Nannospalax galili TaxID=1026970 RepID=UPI00081A06A7|nr:PRAME family member 12-like [Nannospalax galili]
MSKQTLLLDLTMQNLLRNEALTLSALEYLPKELFPPLFKTAFTSRQTNILRAMVQAWPFPCLPLGALMKTPDLDILLLQAVLDGVDMLIAHKEQPRRWKLQVLDLRNTHHNFWNIWAGTNGGCSPQVRSKTQRMGDQAVSGGKKQPLKVLVDLCFKCPDLDEYQEYFLQWAERRKYLLQLCCQKLQIWGKPVYCVLRLLESFEPCYIQELEVNTWWKQQALTWLTPDKSQMRILLKGTYESIELLERMYIDLEERVITTIISHLADLNTLRHLRLNEMHFFEVSLDQVLRSLRSSLETLAITHCHLSQSDLNCLSKYPSTYQLKHLNLSDVKFSRLHVSPLNVLLERVSATLQTLELQDCEMKDSQIKTVLPALSQCSQLTKVNFYGNYISTSVLKNLLHHTASLSHLTLELYPAPIECYNDMGGFLVERFTQLGPALMNTLRAIRKPETVCFASNTCFKCYERCTYILDMSLCSCW